MDFKKVEKTGVDLQYFTIKFWSQFQIILKIPISDGASIFFLGRAN